jgi:hypothetical protein
LHPFNKFQDGGQMKFFAKCTNGIGSFILLLFLLVGFGLVTSQSAMAKSENIIGSAEDHGIILTINNYAIQNYGQEMVVYYTVDSQSGKLMDADETSILKKSDISIGNQRVQGNNIWHKKISNQKYQGAVKVALPQYIPATSNVAFYTDAILNQKGQWTINFQIKK